MPCSLPRWSGSVRNGYSHGALPRRVLPNPLGLPQDCAGSAPTLPLSRPAQASHALRPAWLLAHLKWTSSRGLDHAAHPPSPPATHRTPPSTTPLLPPP